MTKAKTAPSLTTREAARILKALGHEHRLELFLRILEAGSLEASEEPKVCELVQRLKIGAPTISHHLKELASANLIRTERQGKFLVARVNEEMLDQVRALLK